MPFPPPEDLHDPGMEPSTLASPALAGRFLTTSTTWDVPGVLQFNSILTLSWASLIAQLVKNLLAMQETLIQFLGWEDPLEKG